MYAIAHAVEGLYAPDASPIISLMAEEGGQALAAALPAVVVDGANLEARGEAQYGSWLCGGSSARPPWVCTTSSATPSAAP